MNEGTKKFTAPSNVSKKNSLGWFRGMVKTPNPSHSLRPHYSVISVAAVFQPDMLTGSTQTMNRRQQLMSGSDPNNETSHKEFDKRFQQSTTPETGKPYKHSLDAIATLSSGIQMRNARVLQKLVPTFSGMQDTFSEFEHLLRNYLRSMGNRLTEVIILHYIIVEMWKVFQKMIMKVPFSFFFLSYLKFTSQKKCKLLFQQ